jgi:Na+:H+ antiporter
MIPIPAFILGLVLLLLLATVSAILLKKIKFPYTIGLVVIGFAFAWVCNKLPGLEEVRQLRLNHDIILYILLPTLIFDASVNINTRMLKKSLLPVMALAAPGLVISTVVVGLLMAWLTPLSLGESMMFGALISATDPVAVISLFEIVGAPLRLRVMVDGESLFNDATAIVVFNIISRIVLTGAALTMSTLASGGIEFCVVFFGGLVLGAVIGYLMMNLILFSDNDPLIGVALSTIVAYTAFIIADKVFEFSGVMSVLGAGIVISHYGATRFTPKVRLYMKQFWALLTFIANSFIFLLLGFTEDSVFLGIKNWDPVFTAIIWAVVAIQVARGIVVFSIVPLLGWWRKEYRTSWGYQTVMFWGGLRGAVPLALVFSLPNTLPHHSLIVQVTLGVVMFTLLVQGTTIRRLLELFKLDRPDLMVRVSEIKAMIAARKAGVESLARLHKEGKLPETVFTGFELEYKQKIADENRELNQLRNDLEFTPELILFSIINDAIEEEMRTYHKLFEQGFIGEKVFQQLEFHVNQRQDQCNERTTITFGMDDFPLEMRLSRWLNRVLKKLMPNSRYLFKRQVHDALEDYMTAIAVIIAVHDVDAVLQRMDTLYEQQTENIEQCRQYYRRFEAVAAGNLKELEQHHQALLQAIENAAVRHAFYGTEIETLQELAIKGELGEETAEELIARIHTKIIVSTRDLYKLYSEK